MSECLPQAHRYEYDAQMRRVCRRCGKMFWQDARAIEQAAEAVEREPAVAPAPRGVDTSAAALAVLLRDTPEDRERLASAMHQRRSGYGYNQYPNGTTRSWYEEEADAIIAVLRDQP